MADDRYERALATVKRYRGDDATLGHGAMAELTPEFDRLKDEFVWGGVWADETLDLKTRSLCTMSALIILGKDEQLGNHIGWALNIGVTKEQITALIAQMMVYGGLAGSHNAMRVAKDVFAAKGLL